VNVTTRLFEYMRC